MADLFFPQLRTGAIAHYPIRKTAVTRTVSNILPGGTVLMYPDEAARKTTWSWDYVGLTMEEAAALQDFFIACSGPLIPFTFLDPTGNLLSGSSDFTSNAWQASSGLNITGGLPGGLSTVTAMTLVNRSQRVQELGQTVSIPSDFDYCFSVYLRSSTSGDITLFRRSAHTEQALSVQVGLNWKRVWTAGNLQDQSTGLAVGIRLFPGQQVTVCAAQLQPQPGLSSYVDKPQIGDVYSKAHWGIDELSIQYLGPNNCTVSVAVVA